MKPQEPALASLSNQSLSSSNKPSLNPDLSKRKQFLDFEISLTRDQLIDTIAGLLLVMIDKTQPADLSSGSSPSQSSFHMKSAPKISLPSYLQRIAKYTDCSSVCLLIALIYIDRVLKQNENMELDSLNVYKLVAVTLTMAIKYHDAKDNKNEWYAKITGIKLKEFNELEQEFVDSVNAELFVDKQALKDITEGVTSYYFKTQKGSAMQ